MSSSFIKSPQRSPSPPIPMGNGVKCMVPHGEWGLIHPRPTRSGDAKIHVGAKLSCEYNPELRRWMEFENKSPIIF